MVNLKIKIIKINQCKEHRKIFFKERELWGPLRQSSCLVHMQFKSAWGYKRKNNAEKVFQIQSNHGEYSHRVFKINSIFYA